MLIIALLISQGDQLVTAAVPGGMVDHQTAGTALRVDQIHQSWTDEGAMGFFKIAILFDLLFIVMYSLGGVIGGQLVRRDAVSPILKILGLMAMAAYFAFGILDLCETLCQIVQVFFTGGHDGLAGLAELVQPPKLVAFAIGFPVLAVSLIWLRLEKWRVNEAV